MRNGKYDVLSPLYSGDTVSIGAGHNLNVTGSSVAGDTAGCFPGF